MAIRLRSESPIDLDIKKEQNYAKLGSNTNSSYAPSSNLFASNTVGLSSSVGASTSAGSSSSGSSSGGSFSAVA